MCKHIWTPLGKKNGIKQEPRACTKPIWKDGFCKIHHPEAVAERAAEKEGKMARWAEEKERLAEQERIADEKMSDPTVIFLQQVLAQNAAIMGWIAERDRREQDVNKELCKQIAAQTTMIQRLTLNLDAFERWLKR